LVIALLAISMSVSPVSTLSWWSASVRVTPSEIHILPGQKATFTVSVTLTSYGNVDIRFIVVWLKLMQTSGGSGFSIVSKDFGSGPISGIPPFQATLTLQTSSTTPPGVWLFHIFGADSLQDLSTCPTQIGNAKYCGDSGTFGFYVDAPTATIPSSTGFDWGITVSPGSTSLAAGQALLPAGKISLNLVNGKPEIVSLSITGLPSTVGSIELGGDSCSPPCSKEFNIWIFSGAVARDYVLTITGTAGSTSHSTTFTLTVKA
jgi:hypothetical protein